MNLPEIKPISEDYVNLESIIPALYHYLDGNISVDYGSDPSIIRKIMEKNELINPLTIVKTKKAVIIDTLRPYTGEIKSADIKSADTIIADVNQNLVENDVIILISTYRHAIAVYVSKESEIYNVSLINSGNIIYGNLIVFRPQSMNCL